MIYNYVYNYVYTYIIFSIYIYILTSEETEKCLPHLRKIRPNWTRPAARRFHGALRGACTVTESLGARYGKCSESMLNYQLLSLQKLDPPMKSVDQSWISPA